MLLTDNNRITVAGQGITSGFRDVIGLAWRLAIITRSKSVQHKYDQILKGWYTERQQQFQTSLSNTLRNGQVLSSTNPLQNFIRDWVLWGMQFIPSLEYRLRLGQRLEDPVQYFHVDEMPFLSELGGGVYFPQIYCVKLGDRSEEVLFTDDVVFAKNKVKLFQIVVLLDAAEDSSSALTDLQSIDRVSGGHLSAEESTVLAPVSADGLLNAGHPIFRAATAEEFAQSELCSGRPTPRDYDESQLWQMFRSKRYLIVRPERFVFAVCASRAELEQAARELVDMFPLE